MQLDNALVRLIGAVVTLNAVLMQTVSALVVLFGMPSHLHVVLLQLDNALPALPSGMLRSLDAAQILLASVHAKHIGILQNHNVALIKQENVLVIPIGTP